MDHDEARRQKKTIDSRDRRRRRRQRRAIVQSRQSRAIALQFKQRSKVVIISLIWQHAGFDLWYAAQWAHTAVEMQVPDHVEQAQSSQKHPFGEAGHGGDMVNIRIASR